MHLALCIEKVSLKNIIIKKLYYKIMKGVFKLLKFENMNMNINSREFYEVTNNMEVNPNIKSFMKLNVEPGIAIDIGCGAGRDTAFLIKNNWKVVAIDKEDVLEYI